MINLSNIKMSDSFSHIGKASASVNLMDYQQRLHSKNGKKALNVFI